MKRRCTNCGHFWLAGEAAHQCGCMTVPADVVRVGLEVLPQIDNPRMAGLLDGLQRAGRGLTIPSEGGES